MARKERNDVDYFPHPVTHGKKMYYLRSKYGNDGYSVWFMILEQLGKAEFHYLDLSGKIQLMYLSSELMVEEEKLLEIINLLVDFGEFDGELWNGSKVLYNQKFIDNIEDAYKKRNNKCIDKNQLLLLLSSKGILLSSKSIPNTPLTELKVSGNTHRIGKDRIVKDSKGFTPPSLEEVKLYFLEKGYSELSAKKAYEYYALADWFDSKGNAVKNWKQKMLSVWFKPENEILKSKVTAQPMSDEDYEEYIRPTKPMQLWK